MALQFEIQLTASNHADFVSHCIYGLRQVPAFIWLFALICSYCHCQLKYILYGSASAPYFLSVN